MSSSNSSTLQSKAKSYKFDRESKTVTEIVIHKISCFEESNECDQVFGLSKGKDVLFKATEKSIDNRSKEFNRKVSGTLYFGERKMDGTLLFHVKGSEKGSKLLGVIILSADNFKRSSS